MILHNCGYGETNRTSQEPCLANRALDHGCLGQVLGHTKNALQYLPMLSKL